MKIGDVAIPAYQQRDPFRSGCEAYTHAIVVSVDPFVMVSEEGDMMWSCRRADSVIVLCQAHPDATRKAFARFEREKKRTNEEPQRKV